MKQICRWLETFRTNAHTIVETICSYKFGFANKTRGFFNCLKEGKFPPSLKKTISKQRKKSSWVNITVLIVNWMTIQAYRSMDRTLAEYRGEGRTYWQSYVISWILTVILLWELICMIGAKNCARCVGFLLNLPQRMVEFVKTKCHEVCKCGIAVLLIGITLFIGIRSWHTSTCYTSVGEVFGIPVGVGSELSPEEQRKCAAYWKLTDYPFRGQMILTYVEAYHQLDVMREYSTAYAMTLFQPTARIEIDYTKDRRKYSSKYGDAAYDAAHGIGYRNPVRMSYYNDSNEQVLELTAIKKETDCFEITVYSAEDKPQLFCSTLLWIPEGQTGDNSMLFRQIEVTYGANGLPQMRQLKPNIYNLCGVNGERYTYDQDKHLKTLCYLDVNEEPVCNQQGIMQIQMECDQAGHINKIRYYSDEKGEEKTEGFFGVFCEQLEYDENNNLYERKQQDRSESWCYDVNGVYRYR